MQDASRGEEMLKDIALHFNIGLQVINRVLDVGCGYGNFLIIAQKYFEEVFGIEIVEERCDWAKRRAEKSDIFCGCATRLPWPDCHFDLAVCTDVFEHISYNKQNLVSSELMRVIKHGGYAFVSVPNRFQLRDEHNNVWFGTWLPKALRGLYVGVASSNKSFTHCYERTGNGWKRLFKKAGFAVTLEAKLYKGRKYLPRDRYHIYLKRN